MWLVTKIQLEFTTWHSSSRLQVRKVSNRNLLVPEDGTGVSVKFDNGRIKQYPSLFDYIKYQGEQLDIDIMTPYVHDPIYHSVRNEGGSL